MTAIITNTSFYRSATNPLHCLSVCLSICLSIHPSIHLSPRTSWTLSGSCCPWPHPASSGSPARPLPLPAVAFLPLPRTRHVPEGARGGRKNKFDMFCSEPPKYLDSWFAVARVLQHVGVRQNPPHPVWQKGWSLDAYPDAYPMPARFIPDAHPMQTPMHAPMPWSCLGSRHIVRT